MPTMVQVVGRSGSGKTRALEGAIRRLRRRGLRVAVLKHSHHPIEVAGKDTDRLRRSGGEIVVFASDGCVIFSGWDPTQLAAVLPVDVVLVEGFHARRFPGPRFVVRDPTEANGIALRIARSVAGPALRPALEGDVGPVPIGALWEMVGNLMWESGLRRLAFREAPLRGTRRSRGRGGAR